ncbi:hypothetical protein [Gracilibacillus salinarum]|uniref:DUF4358 domain-containing protein n=1 Tax=Gracilibacillus salinarum TaxID=2932255 RepID=A0ABY4GP40_9BACI|nr:hypothetical protein [Gracilibacillus salinarum]UOQ85760.1 hypothetical protein MUN87_02300 [Gracilibacillus salinarum]
MVKRILIFFVLIIFVLGACSQQSEEPSLAKTPDITLDEVETAITEQGLELEKANLPTGNVFIQELNGVVPKAYFVDGTTLSIYVFPTVDAREKGMDDFEEKTAAASLEQHKTFTVQNALVFYVEGSEENNKKLVKAMDALK